MKAFLVLLLLFTGSAWADTLPSDLTTGEQAAINGEINGMFTALNAQQTVWIAGGPGRRFVQVLSRAVKTDGTALRTVDLIGTQPSDRSVGLGTLGVLGGQQHLCDYRIDEYEGTLGKGFEVSCELEIAGVIWRRTRHVGPETRPFVDSATGWYQVIPGP